MLLHILVTTFLILITKLVDGANILAVNTLLSPSHHLFNDVYLFELAKRGHNVTLLGHDEDRHKHPNYTHIVMEGVYAKIQVEANLLEMKNFSNWETINFLWTFAEKTCILDQETEGLKKLTQYPDDFKFDLIIWDINAGQCLFPLIAKFGRPPVIAINPFLNQPNVFKNVWQSYIPFMTYSYGDHMNLWEKLESIFFNVLIEITRVTDLIPRQQQLAENYFGNVNLTVQEVERNISLVLVNYHPIFNYVEALPPNVIPVGGLHIQPKPLPQNLKQILDDSKEGVILFSLGSNVKLKELGNDKVQAIIRTFSKLRQTVIWKFEHDNLSAVSKNVYIQKWVPQNDILGHTNTILFINHGGLLSSHEIVYNGVPVIGIPFFLDQFQNVGNFIRKGIGEKLEFNDLTEDSFYNVIQKVLNNKSYTENAKKLSALYRHQLNTPLDTAIYWTEYILKFKTAAHLNLATRDMNFMEVNNLDIILLFLVPSVFSIVVAFVTMIYFIFKYNQKVKTTKKLKKQ